MSMLSAIELASFSLINMMLLRISGIETNPGPCTYPTNGDTLKWLELLQNEGKISEERLKNEAQIFFSKEIKEDKKVIKKKLFALIQEKSNQLLQSRRKLQKQLGGLGKYGEIAPSDFGLDFSDAKKRNSEFIKMCRADVRKTPGYIKWLDEEFTLMMDSKVEMLKKIQAEKDKILETAKGTETLKLVRERSSGRMIADTVKMFFSQNQVQNLMGPPSFSGLLQRMQSEILFCLMCNASDLKRQKDLD